MATVFLRQQSNIISLKYRFKSFKSMSWNRQKSFIIFVSGKFSKVIAGTEKRKFCLGYGHKIMGKVGV